MRDIVLENLVFGNSFVYINNVKSKESTMTQTNVEPLFATIPAGSDFYIAKQSGRQALPEQHEQIFVAAFAAASRSTPRDYRQLLLNIYEAAEERGYTLIVRKSAYTSFRKLFQGCRNLTDDKKSKACVLRYCDVFVAGILKCPVTDTDMYV